MASFLQASDLNISNLNFELHASMERQRAKDIYEQLLKTKADLQKFVIDANRHYTTSVSLGCKKGQRYDANAFIVAVY